MLFLAPGSNDFGDPSEYFAWTSMEVHAFMADAPFRLLGPAYVTLNHGSDDASPEYSYSFVQADGISIRARYQCNKARRDGDHILWK